MRNPLYSAAIFEVAASLAGVLPVGVSRAIARRIGSIAARKCRARFEIMRRNLHGITGLRGLDLDELTRTTFRNFLQSLADYCWCHRARLDRVVSLAGGLEGAEPVMSWRSGDRGTILATVHLGNWEFGGLHAARTSNAEFVALTQREPDDRLHEWRARYRANHGVRTVTIGDDPFSFVEAVSVLRRGGVVALLVDRPIGRSRHRVTIFGQPVEFSSGCALLARHSDARISPVFVVRGGGAKYRMNALPPLCPSIDGQGPELTQRLAETFAPVMRDYASEYYNYEPLFK